MKYNSKCIKLMLATGLASLVLGCEQESPIKDASSQTYFASVPTTSGNGITSVTGDYNEDGHLDLIVGAPDRSVSTRAKFYLFLGDGKGNFRRVEQTAEKPIEIR